MIATTAFIDHKEIKQYLGVISESAVGGLSILKDFFAVLKDITGGRVEAYEQEITRLADAALDKVKEQAKRLGADAVIGIHFSFGVFSPSERGTVACVVCSGTAVKLRAKETPPLAEENGIPRGPASRLGSGFDWR